MEQLRAFVRVAHGALFFGVAVFVIGSIVNLIAPDDNRVGHQVVSTLLFSLLASLFWYAAESWRSRLRD